MELRHITSFLVLAEELHFGRSAARLPISQPSLSLQLQQLERRLGVRLVARTSHSVRLTPAGEAFCREARPLLAQLDRAVQAARQASPAASGHLRIGFNFPAGQRVLVRFGTRAGRLLLSAGPIAVLVPAQALIIPQFLMITHLGWANTHAGLIVPQLSGCAVPLLLLRQQVRAIPPSMHEAATLDGANNWQALWHVVLPIMRPALAAVAILVFISTWNEYLWPLIATPGGSPGTIQTGLALFLNTEGAAPGPLFAAATLATLPVLAAYLAGARHVTNAFMHSGIE